MTISSSAEATSEFPICTHSQVPVSLITGKASTGVLTLHTSAVSFRMHQVRNIIPSTSYLSDPVSANLTGFGAAVGASDVALAAKRIYQLNFFVGFIVSFSIYYVLCRFVGTVPGMEMQGWHEDLHYEPEDEVSEIGSPGVIRASSSDKDLDSDMTKMA